MNKLITNISKQIWFAALILTMLVNQGCKEEALDRPQTEEEVLTDELDIYIDEQFTQEYNMAVRYKFKSNYIRPGQQVAPPKKEMVRPMLDFIEDYWIDVYKAVDGGEEFFRRYVPAEIVLLGGLIYNGDGTVTLGIADAGARITFTNVNAFDLTDEEWLALQLQTTYHEFAHIVHQEFSLPTAFEKISPAGYSSAGSWYNLTDAEALQRGFVTPYATSSVNEDFAETVAVFLYLDEFYEQFINIDTDCIDANCEADNEGKRKIAQKLAAITEHYKKVTGLDLNELRAVVQGKLIL